MKKATTRRGSRSKAKVSAKKKLAPVAPEDPATPLVNAKHERFCAFRLRGLNQSEAYLAVYGGDAKTARESASRLSTKVNIAARINFLQRQAEDRAVDAVALDKAKVVRWCLRVLETPVTTVAAAVAKHQSHLAASALKVKCEIEPLSPDEAAALDLANEVRPTEAGPQVKSIGKLEAMRLAVDVLGLKKADEDNDKHGAGVVDALAELAASIRGRTMITPPPQGA